jgi:hypothetical protein
MFALEPFLDRFVFGSFPQPQMDHVVGGTIVHTMLVRVGSIVCSARVGSASAGAATSASAGTESSAGADSGPPAAGRSALMVPCSCS